MGEAQNHSQPLNKKSVAPKSGATPPKAAPGKAAPAPKAAGKPPVKAADEAAKGGAPKLIPTPSAAGAPPPPSATKGPTLNFPDIPETAEAPSRKPIGQILKEMRLVTESQIQEALAIQKQSGGALGAILVNLNYVTEQEVLTALGVQAGMEVVELDGFDLTDELTQRVSPSIATVYKIIPIKFENGILTVAMADPLNVKTLDDLRFLLDCEVRGAVSNEAAVARTLDKYYAGVQESVESLLAELDDGMMTDITDNASESIDLQTLEEMADAAPVRKLLNYVLLVAIRDKAADIHFEPFEDEFKIRYRIDGVLYEMVPPPKQLALAISSRIKVMANLDIAERRLPQDGRVELNISGNPVELRVSILPTMFGESCVLRVLDRSVVQLDLRKLGLRQDELRTIEEDLLQLPNGIILVTGPTGSGKTTTLYAALNAVNSIDVKIITTEDPVEYDLEGIHQVNINSDIGLTFAACLRSILRQDPDKILVGEIRDVETAQIAVQASLTGHVVFSTLHTNSAAATITRLIDMGVESYLITATLEAVVAQRLVRRICERCRKEFTPTDDMLMELNLRGADVRGKRFFYGPGCDACNNTGYKGRMGIYEILRLDDEIREIIMSQGSTQAIREVGVRKGMRTLRESGLLSIYDGDTSIEEVVRETIQEHE